VEVVAEQVHLDVLCIKAADVETSGTSLMNIKLRKLT